MTRQLALFFLLLFATSCATVAPVRGVVVLSGEGEPRLTVDGLTRDLRGSRGLLDQLGRLPGAIVDVVGAGSERAVTARSFEIVDPGDGLVPLVGFLVIDQAGVQLEDEVTGTRLALRGEALAELRFLHGARVWITGSVVGPQLWLVAHFGVLVPPPDPL